MHVPRLSSRLQRGQEFSLLSLCLTMLRWLTWNSM